MQYFSNVVGGRFGNSRSVIGNGPVDRERTEENGTFLDLQQYALIGIFIIWHMRSR